MGADRRRLRRKAWRIPKCTPRCTPSAGRLKRGEFEEPENFRGFGRLLISLRIAQGMSQRRLDVGEKRKGLQLAARAMEGDSSFEPTLFGDYEQREIAVEEILSSGLPDLWRMVMLHGRHAPARTVRGSDQNAWVVFGKQKWSVLANAEDGLGRMPRRRVTAFPWSLRPTSLGSA